MIWADGIEPRLIRPVGAAVAFAAWVGFVAASNSSTSAAPIQERDPFLVSTKWKGKLTQKGTFAGGGSGPPVFDVLLTITKRDGAAFEAELREEADAIKLTYVVKGEIAPLVGVKKYRVSFKSEEAKDVSNTTPLLGIPYKGTLSGRSMKGTWKLPKSDDGADIEGEFSLEYAG